MKHKINLVFEGNLLQKLIISANIRTCIHETLKAEGITVPCEINVLLTWFFRWMGALCVRGTREELDVIDQTVEACRNGGTLLIFPEGTREKEGKLLQPKSGLFVIAAQAAVDVVPVRILYDTPDGRMKLFCKVKVVYGEPMPAAQFAMESRRDLKTLRANKQALLDAWEDLSRP